MTIRCIKCKSPIEPHEVKHGECACGHRFPTGNANANK